LIPRLWSGAGAAEPVFRQSPARKVPATSDKVRDRALLLLGFAGAIRRSELIALNLEDLEFCEHSLLVMLRKSKTDQEGEGATVAIARGSSACPVNAVCDWIAAS
jgi:site-specific recombinase XerC